MEDDGAHGTSSEAFEAAGPWAFTKTPAEPCVSAPSSKPQPEKRAEAKEGKEPKSVKDKLSGDEYAQLVAKMTRYIVFKGSNCEPIVQANLNKDVLGDKYAKMRLGKQVFFDAAQHVEQVFGYRLVRAPTTLFPQNKYKDCFYLINGLGNPNLRADLLADASTALRGLLTVVLAMTYCSNHNSRSHAIPEVTAFWGESLHMASRLGFVQVHFSPLTQCSNGMSSAQKKTLRKKYYPPPPSDTMGATHITLKIKIIR